MDAPQFGFSQYTVNATATSALSTLVFSAQDDTGFYSLDDVSVTATPEPAAYGLVGIAVALFTVLRRVWVVRVWVDKGETCRQ